MARSRHERWRVRGRSEGAEVPNVRCVSYTSVNGLEVSLGGAAELSAVLFVLFEGLPEQGQADPEWPCPSGRGEPVAVVRGGQQQVVHDDAEPSKRLGRDIVVVGAGHRLSDRCERGRGRTLAVLFVAKPSNEWRPG